MIVKVGNRELEMEGEHLTSLRSSNELLGDITALRARLAEDGYLLLRDFHNRDQVMKARRRILEKMDRMGKLDRDTLLEEGYMADGSKTIFMGGRTRICRSC